MKEDLLRLVAVSLLVVACLVVLVTEKRFVTTSFANSASPPASHTGAPRPSAAAESHCSACHTSASAGDTISVSGGGAGNTYQPGTTYTMTVSHTASGLWGFEATSLINSTVLSAGTQSSLDSSTITKCATPTNLNVFPPVTDPPCGASARYYTYQSARSSGGWTFQWTAPASDVGPITFYIAGVKGNGDALSANDPAYSGTLTLTAAAVTPSVSVAVSSSSVAEDGATNLVYTFTRTTTTGSLTVNFSVGGTATFNTDYTQSGATTFGASSGTVTFSAGSSTATVTLDPTADTTVESNETAVLTVTSGSGYNVGSPSAATGTINNDDTDVTVAVAPASVAEDGATNLVYTFTRNGVTTGALTVNFSVGGTATFNMDYTQSGATTFGASSGTVTFSAGSSTATVTLDPTADTTVESNETAVLTVTSGSGYNVGSPSAATGTINNDDTDVTVAVAPASVTEDGATNLVYTFTRNGVTSGALSVNFSVGGTATFNTDYTQTGASSFGAGSGTVTIGAGNSTATVIIDPTTDSTFEPDETVLLTVTAGTGYNVGNPSTATGTITNDDSAPQQGTLQFSLANYSQTENGGTAAITVTRIGGSSGAASVQFSNPAGGSATGGASCTAGVDYVTSTATGTLNWTDGESASKQFNVTICNDSNVEGNETVNLLLSNATGASLGGQTSAMLTITDDDASLIQFSQPSYSLGEGGGSLVVTVTRVGDASGTSTVDYATSDTASVTCSVVTGAASSHCDYLQTLGTLKFAANETVKMVQIPIVDDSWSEGIETFKITLSNVIGSTLGTSVADLTITDNDVANGPNPIDDSGFFVRQHYIDFLNREPDGPGFNFWKNEIDVCGADAQCKEVKRINVSAAFFLSIEFQNTGYLVYRTYKSAFGNLKNPPNSPIPVVLTDFLRDTQLIGQGVVVTVGNWQQQLEANKQTYMLEFVRRPAFQSDFPNTLTAQQFVDQLNTRAGGVLSAQENANLVAMLGATPSDETKRSQVLRAVAEDSDLQSAESNRAFVLTQYFGYLRRNPNDPPDNDFSGFNFWLNKLNDFGGNFINAEMVKAFLLSSEYRQRFGQQ